MTSPLFTPFELRPGVVSRNRVWLAPLTNQQSHPDGTLSDDEERFLAMRADGGFGVVETCATYVHQGGKAWPGELGAHDDATLPGLTRLASRLRAGGALGVVQLFHGGVRAPSAVSGSRPVGPGELEAAGGEISRAATDDDVRAAVRAFAHAAARCERAGFDGVEIHGAHGYLLSQFLSAEFNRRTDAWGGDFERRARLMREVTRAVRAAAPSLALAVRISPEDFGQAKGLDLDENLALARALVDEGADVIHLSLWRAHLTTAKRPSQHPTPLFREVVGRRARIVVAGGIWTREEAEAQLALGADAVALGRAAIANPDWPARAAEDPAWAPRRPPLTPAELDARGLSPAFAEYMRQWKGFVTDPIAA